MYNKSSVPVTGVDHDRDIIVLKKSADMHRSLEREHPLFSDRNRLHFFLRSGH